MSDTKFRAQILLEPEQHRAISEIAQEQGESISSLVREIIQEYLTKRDREEKQRWEIQAIYDLSKLRDEIQAQHGLIRIDFLAEARDEREVDLEERGGEEN